MSKGIWIAIGIAVLAAAGALLFMQKAEAPTAITEQEASAPLELLRSAKMTVPESDTVVTLVNGQASFEIAPGSAQEGSIRLVDGISTSWEKGERTDLLAAFTVETGGTATFLYLVLFDVNDGTLTKKSEAFLGDRIDVTHIGVGELVHDGQAEYRVTLQTLIRKETDPFSATPSVQETRTFYVIQQILKEVEVGRDDT